MNRLLIVLIAAVCITLQNWNMATAIIEEEKGIRRTSRDPEQLASAYYMAGEKVRQLPVLNIEPAFADLCAELSGWYNQVGSTSKNNGIFIDQYTQAKKRLSGPDATTEAVLLGMLGDPLKPRSTFGNSIKRFKSKWMPYQNEETN